MRPSADGLSRDDIHLRNLWFEFMYYIMDLIFNKICAIIIFLIVTEVK